jgi:DegV family protein with EDD domain
MVKIVTDCLGDIPADIIQDLGITIIPLSVHFGTEVYVDGIDLTTEQFYQKLVSSKALPTTSVPPMGKFLEVYEKLAEETNEILVITVSRKLSAVYEAALQAISHMTKQCRIEVIDSMTILMAEGLVVVETAKAAKNGVGIDGLMELTRRNMQRADARMAFDTLEYLKKGGRIGKAQAFLGSLVKLHPILGIRDGEIFPMSRERSRSKAIDYLRNFVKKYKKIDALAVEEATSSDEADALAESLADMYPKENIYRSKVCSVLGTHTGPHVIGVAVLGDKE